MKIIFVLLLFLFSVDTLIGQSLSENDLKRILLAVQNKQIIGLGEPEHFYKGYYDAKIQLIKHLVEKNQVDAIVLEASAIDCKYLDDYIKGKCTIIVSEILPKLNIGYSSSGLHLFDAKEILEFVEWLKEANTTRNQKISIYGIDFQNYETPIKQLRNYFKDKPVLKESLDLLDKHFLSLLNQFKADPSKFMYDSAWMKQAKDQYALAQDIQNKISHMTNDKWINYNFIQLLQYAYIYTDPNTQRDKFMFENILRHYDPKIKMLLWAANPHIANDSFTNNIGKYTWLGRYLTEKFGNQYFKIALVEDQTESILKNPLSRITYPIPEGAYGSGHFDLLIKCNKGPVATILLD